MNSNTVLLLITIALFIVLYAAGCIAYADRGFTNLQTFLNLFRTNAGLICVACGMTCVMLTGGIDISVGSLVALDCMLMAYGMSEWGISAPVMILLVLVIGLVFGLVQGLCVGYLEIQPFIVTMAGMFFARGMTAVISTNQLSITVEINQLFYDMANYRIYLPAALGYANKKGIIQVPYIGIGVVVALVVLVIVFLVLRYTKFGRSLYAVGGSEQSAAMMGLDVKKTKLKTYVLSSFLCSVGGICYCMNTMSASVSHRYGDGRHFLRRYRRHPAYRRRGQRDRLPLWRTDQRHHFHHRENQRQAGLLLAQHSHRSPAVLLHRAAERVRQIEGTQEVRRR